jgi:hypothetical protein
MRRTYVVMLFAVGLLTACSSSSPTSVISAPASGVPATASPADASGPASPPAGPSSPAATGTATDGQGDKATVSITVGNPTPLTNLNQQNVNACDDFGDISADASQTIAIPVQITVTVTSSLATSVGVDIDGTHEVTSGGDVDVNGNLPSWATESGGGPQCDSSGGGVTWNNLAPGQPSTWSGWLIDPEAITPDDPAGSSAKKMIFLEPVVNMGSSDGNFVPDLADSMNLVTCTAGVPFGAVIAVDPQVALAAGCTKYTGN